MRWYTNAKNEWRSGGERWQTWGMPLLAPAWAGMSLDSFVSGGNDGAGR